VLLLLEGHTEE